MSKETQETLDAVADHILRLTRIRIISKLVTEDSEKSRKEVFEEVVGKLEKVPGSNRKLAEWIVETLFDTITKDDVDDFRKELESKACKIWKKAHS